MKGQFVRNLTKVSSVGLVALASISLAQGEATKTVWDGVYSAAQVQRGAKILSEQCSLCHGEQLQGGPGIPGVVGPAFMFNWDNKPVRGLFDFIRTTMPPGQAGSLADQSYADVVAALLQANGFPESTTGELAATPEALDAITFKKNKP
jgi:quinoprotein glucose dehydrogenase